jgi:hypothetical protein
MDDPYSPLSSNVPLPKVLELRSQGTPNNQIIQILQNEGYSSDQIFDAMNQADMQQNIGQGMTEPTVGGPQGYENQMGMQPEGYGGYGQQMEMGGANPNRESMEETAEAIINEKWKQITITIQKFTESKDKMEHRLTQLEMGFKHLQDNFDKLHQALIGKIGEYDQNILNVGTEIKAMEKVFQKILPTFTENVNELSRLTQKMKGQ